MEELFRFMMARPAQRAKVDDRYRLRTSPDYLKNLKSAKVEGRARVRGVAEEFARTMIHSVDDLTFGPKLLAFGNALPETQPALLADLSKIVQNHFGAKPQDVVRDAALARDRERLSDLLVTSAIVGTDFEFPSELAARLLRLIALIERVAAGDKTLETQSGLADALDATLIYPPEIFPLRDEPAGQGRANVNVAAGTGEDRERRRIELLARRQKLIAAHEALTRVTPEDVESRESEPAPPRREDGGVVRAEPVPPAGIEALAPRESAAPVSGELSARAATRAMPLLLRPEAVKSLDESVQQVFAERRVDLTGTRITTVLDRLSVDIQDVDRSLAELMTKQDQLVRVGSSWLPVSAFGGVDFKAATVPKTHGSVAPAGIGDLLVVKQNLKRYEPRELAHIENILAGEYKERMHRRARRTEETITVEVEAKKEEERDTQTTERFEMKTEASQTVKDDVSFKAGLAISGKYGPVVEFKASTDFALNHSKEESTKVATSYSKDVTTRASSKISERRREERILKTIEEFEEKNTHGVDNKGKSEHIVGQYQWVDKIYEAQVFNYGKRLLFDVMIPEPAAFLLHATTKQPAAGADLVKPDPFTLTPMQIDEWNYSLYVQRYQTLGVQPPPQPYVTASKTFEGEGTQDNGVTKAADIPIPDGYQAITATVCASFNGWSGHSLDMILGKNMHDFQGPDRWTVNLHGEVGSLPAGFETFKVSDFVVGVEIHCQRTQRLYDDWRIKTHGAILQAYLKLLRDYEEKLSAAQVAAGVQIQGRNPLENQQMIRTEIKKSAISVFTAQFFDLFDAINSGPFGYPEIDLPEAAEEGKYIRFFEQAFEWEQMMFFFYPYYWGRKGNWISRAMLQDVDPLFADFIRAGSARAVISVRPGFEDAVAYFLDTGEVWNGGDLPKITSPLYVSIIEEIRERDKAPGKEIAEGDPWDVRLPTTLVRLTGTPKLPEWKKNPQGEWVPA
jgi:hypothetical protein